MDHASSHASGISVSLASVVAQDDPIRAAIATSAQAVRDHTPLVQSFTNFVTINFVANAQLAAGGAAAMGFMPEEVMPVAQISGATYINVGTLLPSHGQALEQITHQLADEHRHWVLDPVAAGLGEARTRVLTAMRDVPPSIVRSNASEAIALATMWGLLPSGHSAHTSHGPAGVESTDDVDGALDAAMRIARHIRATRPDNLGAVAISGEIDLVTDGERVFRLTGGSAMMTKVTGVGCALGGVMATYLCEAEPLVAATAASVLFNQAGTEAAGKAQGPGSFQTRFVDALWNTRPETIACGSILEVR